MPAVGRLVPPREVAAHRQVLLQAVPQGLPYSASETHIDKTSLITADLRQAIVHVPSV